MIPVGGAARKGVSLGGMGEATSPIPLGYNTVRRRPPTGVLVAGLIFCAGCPLAWLIAAELVFAALNNFIFFPLQFWICLVLCALVPVLVILQARVLTRGRIKTARWMVLAHLGMAGLAIWVYFPWIIFFSYFVVRGLYDQPAVRRICLFIFSVESISALLHWRWARAMQRAVETGSEFEPGGNAEGESGGMRLGRFWRRLPGWVRWPLMGIAFVAVAFAEFYAVLLGALLILS